MSDYFDSDISRREVIARAARLAAAGLSIGPLAGLLEGSIDMPFVDAANPVTISMWGNHPEWKTPLQNMMNRFEKANPGVRVQLIFKPNGNYAAALQTALAGGAAPDLIGYIEGTSIRQAAKQHLIAPLKGKVSVSGMLEAARSQVQFNGNVWGAPLAAYSVGLFYQRPIFARYGLHPPKTWAELVNVCKTLKAKGQVAMAMPAQDMIIPFFFYTMAASAVLGSGGFAQLLKGKRKLTDPDLVRAAQLMIDLIPYYNPGFQSVAYAEGKALFAEGKAAMIIGGTSDFTGYQQVNSHVDVGVVGFPSPNGNNSITVTGMELNYGVNASVSAERRAAATKLVAWIASTHAQQTIANTIGRPTLKGVHSKVGGERGRVAREFVTAGRPDLPVWIDLPQATNLLSVIAKSGGGVFTGSLSASAFAQLSQTGMSV